VVGGGDGRVGGRGARGGRRPEGDAFGAALALANVVFFAIFFLLSKRSRPDIGVVPFLTGVMLTASVLVTAFVVVAGEPVVEATATDLVYALIVAAGPGFLGHVVMTWPLRWIPANIPPVMRLGTPVLASTWAWLFLGDTVGAWQVWAGHHGRWGRRGGAVAVGRELVRAEGRRRPRPASAPPPLLLREVPEEQLPLVPGAELDQIPGLGRLDRVLDERVPARAAPRTRPVAGGRGDEVGGEHHALLDVGEQLDVLRRGQLVHASVHERGGRHPAVRQR
jgi:hypothetical protein